MSNSNEPFRILVVDDDQSQLELISHLLRKYLNDEAELTTTAHIPMGIGLAIANKVDLCVTDLDMPNRNGFELLKRLKETNPLILVIVVTAIASENALKSALAFGADDYLMKPLKHESLVESVRFQMSRLKRYRSEILRLQHAESH